MISRTSSATASSTPVIDWICSTVQPGANSSSVTRPFAISNSPTSVTTRFATLLQRRETRCPSGHHTRERWAAWRADLASLSRRGGSIELEARDRGKILLPAVGLLGLGTRTGMWLTEPSVEEGTRLADGLAAAETQFVTALLAGFPLIVAALLMGRANRDLFERELAPVLRGLSRGPRDPGYLGEYPSSLWIDIVGVTGVVLAMPALAGFAFAVIEGLSS